MKGCDNRAADTDSPPDPNSDLPTPANANAHRSSAAQALPSQSPRLLTRQQAAAYCGVTPDTFDVYRRRGIVPDPIPGTSRWDRKLIDIWLDRASGIASETTSSLDEWRTRRHG